MLLERREMTRNEKKKQSGERSPWAAVSSWKISYARIIYVQWSTDWPEATRYKNAETFGSRVYKAPSFPYIKKGKEA